MNSRRWTSNSAWRALTGAVVATALLAGCRMGDVTSSLCETADDCVGTETCLNGLCRRVCIDNGQCRTAEQCADGVCVARDNAVPCSPTDPPRACTPLPAGLWHLAGVGACYLGAQRCLDGGTWETTCVGGIAVPEVASNNIDDDCDGLVDEGSSCAPAGSSRPCFLGMPPEQVATSVKGECVAGVQACEPDSVTGDRWSSTCLGEVRPQRITADPSLGSGGVGFEFAELAGPDVATSQCDGLDNDCDERFDEEPWFDTDADGYTVCGTTFTPDPVTPAVNTFTAGGTDSQNIDCDDHDGTVRPGLHLGYNLAGNCPYCLPALLDFCDPLVASCVRESTRPLCMIPDADTCVGSSTPSWSAAALGTDSYGDCTAIGAGCCLPGGTPTCCKTLGSPCASGTECASTFCVENVCCDTRCAGACDSCTQALNGVANGSCGPIASQTEDTAPSNLCTMTGAGCGASACQCAPTTSTCLAADGETCVANSDCASNECECANATCSTKVCSAVTCACHFNADGDTTCEGVIADSVDDADDSCAALTCNGAGVCHLANGVACTSNTDCSSNECECANNACSLKVCSAVDCGTCRYNATGDGTCEGNVADGVDDADDSCGSLTCNGSGACNLANGVTCTSNGACETNECECANATCASKMCSAIDCGCTYTNGTACVGNISDGIDDADNTCGTRTCNGAGSCNLANGNACASASVCESNFCVEGYCCNNACTGTCYSCMASLTASGNGTCAVFNVQQTDTAPTALCTNTGVGCPPGTSCQCAPSLGLCKKATGQSCATGTECASGVCLATSLCQ